MRTAHYRSPVRFSKEQRQWSAKANVNLCRLIYGSTVLYEKSYSRVGFSPFSPRMTGPELRSPKLRVCVSGNGQGAFLVVARVRFLVKPLLCWQSAGVTMSSHIPHCLTGSDILQ